MKMKTKNQSKYCKRIQRQESTLNSTLFLTLRLIKRSLALHYQKTRTKWKRTTFRHHKKCLESKPRTVVSLFPFARSCCSVLTDVEVYFCLNF